MRRTAIIEKAKKLLKYGTRKPIIPWINYFGANPPPVGYEGMVLNYTVREDEDETDRAIGDVN